MLSRCTGCVPAGKPGNGRRRRQRLGQNRPFKEKFRIMVIRSHACHLPAIPAQPAQHFRQSRNSIIFPAQGPGWVHHLPVHRMPINIHILPAAPEPDIHNDIFPLLHRNAPGLLFSSDTVMYAPFTPIRQPHQEPSQQHSRHRSPQ